MKAIRDGSSQEVKPFYPKICTTSRRKFKTIGNRKLLYCILRSGFKVYAKFGHNHLGSSLANVVETRNLQNPLNLDIFNHLQSKTNV